MWSGIDSETSPRALCAATAQGRLTPYSGLDPTGALTLAEGRVHCWEGAGEVPIVMADFKAFFRPVSPLTIALVQMWSNLRTWFTRASALAVLGSGAHVM